MKFVYTNDTEESNEMINKTHINGNNAAGSCLNCEGVFSVNTFNSPKDERGGFSNTCPHCGMSVLRIWKEGDELKAGLSQSPQNMANNFCPSGGKELFITTNGRTA